MAQFQDHKEEEGCFKNMYKVSFNTPFFNTYFECLLYTNHCSKQWGWTDR